MRGGEDASRWRRVSLSRGAAISETRRLIDTARGRRVVGARVVSVAVAYNVLAVAIALSGWMNPLLAAVLMPISSVVTLAIASRAGSGV